MAPKKHANLSGKLKSHADSTAVKDLAKVFKSAASLQHLPKWAGTLPCIDYPTIKMNRRPTAACKHALAKHSDLMEAIQELCSARGKALKLERTTIRDALLEAFVEKPTLKYEAKASTLATRMYLMVTHQRRLCKGPDASGVGAGAEADVCHDEEQDDEEHESGPELAPIADASPARSFSEVASATLDCAQSFGDSGSLPPRRSLSSYAFAAAMGLSADAGSASEAGESPNMDGESFGAEDLTAMDTDMGGDKAVVAVGVAATEDVFPEYDPVAQTAYVVQGGNRVEALRLHQPDADGFVVATFAEGILTDGTDWEIPTLSKLPQRWGGKGTGMQPQQSRARTTLKRPASAAATTSEKVRIADHEYDIAQKTDRGIIYCIMLKTTGETRKQVLQLTKPQMVAAGITPCDDNGWRVMRDVLRRISKCTEPVTSKATLQEFKEAAVRYVSKQSGAKK